MPYSVNVKKVEQLPTVADIKKLVIDAGYEPVGDGFEDDVVIICSSRKIIPGTYGHPAYSAQYNKRTGWLTWGINAVKLVTA